MPITLVDKTDGSDPKRRETFWMHTLKTLSPYGFNVENGILNSGPMSGGKNFLCWLGIVSILDYWIDYGLEFRTRLLHYSDTNAGPCSV